MTALHIGRGDGAPVGVPLNRLNRHVLVTGATGTGKTTTAGAICERLADSGVPVLALDAKGDLEGVTMGRAAGQVFDPFGERGHARPLDLEMIGPDNLARALELSEAQSGALFVAYSVARLGGMPLHNLADLGAVLKYCGRHAAAVSEAVGLVSPASLAAVSRALLRLEGDAGAAFGVSDLGFRFDPFEAAKIGGLTILSCARVTHTPGLYGAAAAYVLGRLFEKAPEVGDPERPAMAVLFDEAHLIFDGAPVAQSRRLEQAVRLIRSKGICCIFATQSPADLPPGVSGQLQTRIQHALRGATQAQRRAIQAAAESMPLADGCDGVAEIQQLPIGHALVSVPDRDGAPTIAQTVKVAPPRAPLGPLPDWRIERDPQPVAWDSIFPDPSQPAPAWESPIEATGAHLDAKPLRLGNAARWAALILLLGLGWRLAGG